MAAAAHLLVGTADRQDELNNQVAIMLGGGAPNVQTLMHWANWVRQGGRPIIHFSFKDDQYTVPTVAMVCEMEGQIRIFENCHLWQRRSGGGAVLIPDSFTWGAYVVDGDLKLVHHPRVPVGRRSALDGMRRAYRRLAEISHAQVQNGQRFSLPTELERRAA